MKIILLNGSPRKDGNTVAMIEAFEKGLGPEHELHRFDVAHLNIAGCRACEACHVNKSRKCIIQDDMQQIYPILDEADMIVLASPVYYHAISGQLNTAMNRIYALDKPKKLKKAALMLSSGSDHVYDGAIYQYQNSFLDYLKLEDQGIFTAYGEQNKSQELLDRIESFARNLSDEPDKPEEERAKTS